jgi:RNA polymerase sigma-70 factor (ECF subfamily)
MRNGDSVWSEKLRLNAVLSGDESAWRTWYDENYAPLEAYVHWRCAHVRDVADDVLQETWLTALRNVRRFRPETGSFLSWLRGVAANVIRNQLRHRRRLGRRQQSLVADPPCDGALDCAKSSREQSERIAQALAALPDQYEAVLRAKYLEQLTVATIAERSRQTVKAVESLLTRARSAFREAFAKQETNS